MTILKPTSIAFILIFSLLLSVAILASPFTDTIVAQDVPAVDPMIPVPRQPPQSPTPAPPVPIPEPITVVLFGTGLAALSAAAASRRKNQE